MLWQSALHRDIPITLGIFMVAGAISLLLGLVVDPAFKLGLAVRLGTPPIHLALWVFYVAVRVGIESEMVEIAARAPRERRVELVRFALQFLHCQLVCFLPAFLCIAINRSLEGLALWCALSLMVGAWMAVVMFVAPSLVIFCLTAYGLAWIILLPFYVGIRPFGDWLLYKQGSVGAAYALTVSWLLSLVFFRRPAGRSLSLVLRLTTPLVFGSCSVLCQKSEPALGFMFAVVTLLSVVYLVTFRARLWSEYNTIELSPEPPAERRRTDTRRD